MYWLEKNLSQGGEDAAEKGNSGSKKEKATLSSPSFMEADRETSRKLSDRWHLDYDTLGCGSDEVSTAGKSCLRKVSFAPCDRVEDEEPLKIPVEVIGADSDDIKDASGGCSEDDAYEEILSPSFFDAEDSAGDDETAIERPELEEEEEEGEKEKVMDSQDQTESCSMESRDRTESPAVKSLYYLQPKLPSRKFPPPSPPPDVAHYTRSTASNIPHLLNRKTQSEDDYLSYHIKKKLLVLKLKEKGKRQKSRTRLLGVSSQNSSSSTTNKEESRRRGGAKRGGSGSRPLFNSAVDSDLTDESNPTVYYTPKQSLEFQRRGCSRDFTDEEMPAAMSSFVYEDAVQDQRVSGGGDDLKALQGHNSQNLSLAESENFGAFQSFNRNESNNSQSSKSSGVSQNSGDESKSSGDEDSASGSTHLSLCSSNSAPSFLISSSTQLCQCIGGSTVSNEKFKALLDRICEGSGKSETSKCEEPEIPSESSKPSTPCFKESSEVFEDAKNTPDGKKLCAVDESWWKKIEASCSATEGPVDELDMAEQKSPDILSSDFEKPLDSPVVKYRKIELDDLLNRLYPRSDSFNVSFSDPESFTIAEIAQTESETIPDGFVIHDSELGDLVELLGEDSEPSEGNETNYEQAEMSLDICSGDMEQIGSAIECLLPPPLLPTPEPKIGHISINISEDVNFSGTVEPNESANSNESSPTKCFGQECFAPLSSCLCTNILDELSFELKGNENEKEQVIQDEKETYPSLSTDLIDIGYEPERERFSSTPKRKVTVQNSSFVESSLDTTSDWQDLSLSYTQPQQDCRLLQGNCLKPDTTSLPDTSCTDTSFDNSFLSPQRHLCMNLKQLDKDTLALLEPASQNEDGNTSGSKTNSVVMESLCSATDILEKSHNCLAKSVHSLCERAIIKQSNISLELVLPSSEIESEGEMSDSCCFKRPSAVLQQPKHSVLNVELNSSIFYPQSESKKAQLSKNKKKQD